MKFIEFAAAVVCGAGLALLFIMLAIDNGRLCGFVSDGHRQCVVVVDRHE